MRFNFFSYSIFLFETHLIKIFRQTSITALANRHEMVKENESDHNNNRMPFARKSEEKKKLRMNVSNFNEPQSYYTKRVNALS